MSSRRLCAALLPVHVINGALQPISIPPGDTYISTLGGTSWKPNPQEVLIFQGNNPGQERDVNLKASSVTRTVGGMATHWTCACRTFLNTLFPLTAADAMFHSHAGR